MDEDAKNIAKAEAEIWRRLDARIAELERKAEALDKLERKLKRAAGDDCLFDAYGPDDDQWIELTSWRAEKRYSAGKPSLLEAVEAMEEP